MEDLRIAAQIYKKGSFAFTFDLNSQGHPTKIGNGTRRTHMQEEAMRMLRAHAEFSIKLPAGGFLYKNTLADCCSK